MNLIQTNRARSRMLSTSVRRDVVHEVCSSSWERKPNLGGCGRASSWHGRTLRCSGSLTKHSYVTSRKVGML